MILKRTQVVCKKCNKVLTVDNPKQLRTAFCVCGICKSRIEVNFWVERNITETTLYDENNGMVTSLPSSNNIIDYTAKLLVNNNNYTLSIGNNIVGRWSPTKTADIQLLTQDEYLSRQHILVNVYRQADGHLRVTVKNYKNKNATLVNGRELGSDTLVISDGDIITMGDTEAKLIVTPSPQREAEQ